MQVILASADSSLKAGIVRSLKTRIDRIVHYASVYDAVMRQHREEVRARCHREVDVREDHDGSDAASNRRDDSRLGCVPGA